MKTLFAGLLICSLAACANTNTADTVMSFGADFKFRLPQSMLVGATVFSSDELSVKTATGQLFSGKILSAESEQLPPDFDMQLYPEYLLKRITVDGLPPKIAQLFANSIQEVDHSYGISGVNITQLPDWAVYSLCKQQRCMAYVVKKANQEFILTLHANGLSATEFITLIKGGLYVERE